MFGTSTPVTSIKSMIGHTLGASGAIACISSVLALKSLFIPPTINHNKQEPEMEPIDIVSKTRIINDDKKYSLINAFGFGGHNASVILKKYTE